MKTLLDRFRPASRKNVDRETDPYLPRKGASSVGACPKCHAIRRNKRWYFDDEEYSKLARKPGAAVEEKCPACRKIADGFTSGVVNLSGGFLQDHRKEIINLVRNAEKRAMGFNPLARIVSLTEKEGSIEVRTTGEKLAQRIGREVKKAFRGVVVYRWSEDSKLLRVDWAREW